MAETNGDKYGYFFNSENGDRKYNATSVEMWLKKFFTSGVFYGDLQVTANDDMTVTSASGYANTEGKVRFFSSGENLVIETAHATYDRIDTIVVERNDTDRQIIRKVVKGGYSSKPEPTAPVRSDGVYQMVLAEIYVAAGATSITQSVITDKRADKAVCGYVVCPVDNFDFNQFTTQCNAFLTEFKQEEKERFITWFDDIKNQLSGDVAANLQLQIGTLDALKTENKSNLVAAINEVNEKDIDVLDTREEIQANTTPGKVAGALPVKELYSSLLGYPDMSQRIYYNDWVKSFSWTATQDCWVLGICDTRDSINGSIIKLNGVSVICGVLTSSTIMQSTGFFPCKKGDIISKDTNGTTLARIEAYAMRS